MRVTVAFSSTRRWGMDGQLRRSGAGHGRGHLYSGGIRTAAHHRCECGTQSTDCVFQQHRSCACSSASAIRCDEPCASHMVPRRHEHSILVVEHDEFGRYIFHRNADSGSANRNQGRVLLAGRLFSRGRCCHAAISQRPFQPLFFLCGRIDACQVIVEKACWVDRRLSIAY